MASQRRAQILLGLCVLMFLAAFAQSDLGGDGARLRAIKATLIGPPYADFNDPQPTLEAARELRSDWRAPLYAGFRRENSSFVYPPLAAVLYEPLTLADDPNQLLLRLDQLACLVIVAIAMLLARPAGTWAVFATGVAAVTFHPLMRAVELNQASVMITLAVGICLVATTRGRDITAGIALAFAISIKPHLVLMLPVMWWHARRTTLATIVACAALLVIATLCAGIANHVEYVRTIIPALSDGYAFYPNQSWNGLLNRLVHDDMRSFALAPSSTAVRVLTPLLGLATVGVGSWLAYRAPRDGDRRVIAIAFAWLIATLASPLAWEHHYAPALLLFALWLRLRCADASLARWDVLAAFAWMTIANYFEVRGLSSTATRLFASYMLLGGIALAVAIQRALHSSKSWIKPAKL